MAHLPPNAAIFSPSVARAAASAAKDWNYVDSWLSSKYHGRTPPAFERNADTLRVLLALAAANETADEERDLVARVDAAALKDLEARQKHVRAENAGRDPRGDGVNGVTGEQLSEDVLDTIEANLPREAKAALDTMAAAAVELGIAFPEPEALGRKMVALQADVFGLEQAHARVVVLQRYLDGEARKIEGILREVEGNHYRPAADLAKQNLETQRKVKAIATKLPELQDKVAALAASIGMPKPTIEQVRDEEQAYLDLLAQKKELDVQVKAFQGLPPDMEHAREELESLRAELREVTQRRDAVFEGLVERETPRKPRR
ncbi:hypothetical protein GQ53DRAFT_750274 [Thozetella sp. PMI_491]|nr:hypothetical protein GQ53DRAFT_750274 [Thozetella sp. PMI_491]